MLVNPGGKPATGHKVLEKQEEVRLSAKRPPHCVVPVHETVIRYMKV